MRRYYFITEWLYHGGLWIAVCAVDALASFKLEIGNSYQYITRAYSDYDPSIIDTAYITKGYDILRNNATLTPSAFWGADAWGNNGTVVIGVVGSNNGAIGAVTYYAMQMTTFGAFMGSMLSGISWANISTTEISEELQKALINPTQYIVSARWFPILFSSISTGITTLTLNLGWWNFTLSASAKMLTTVSSAWVSRDSELTIPHNPQATSDARLAYLDMSPYTTYMLKFLPFGIFEIDSTELFGKTYMGLKVDLNLMTGDAVLKVTAKGVLDGYNWDNAFLVTEGQIGVPLPIGQVRADLSNLKQGLNYGAAIGAMNYIGGLE